MPTLRASSSEVKEASFRSNGLSSKGAAFLLRALPKALESIDFSQNDLSQSDSWCAGSTWVRLGVCTGGGSPDPMAVVVQKFGRTGLGI